MFDEIYKDIEFLEKNIIKNLNSINIKEYIIQSLDNHYYTKKNNGFYYAEVFYTNENFSHLVKFSDFKFIEVMQLKIDYQFINQDTKIDIITSVETTDGDKFIITLKGNCDLSIYDVEYWVS